MRGDRLAQRDRPLAAVLHAGRLEAQAAALGEKPAVLLVQVELGRLSGFELASSQRQAPQRRRLLWRFQPVQKAATREDEVALDPNAGARLPPRHLTLPALRPSFSQILNLGTSINHLYEAICSFNPTALRLCNHAFSEI